MSGQDFLDCVVWRLWGLSSASHFSLQFKCSRHSSTNVVVGPWVVACLTTHPWNPFPQLSCPICVTQQTQLWNCYAPRAQSSSLVLLYVSSDRCIGFVLRYDARDVCVSLESVIMGYHVCSQICSHVARYFQLSLSMPPNSRLDS